MKRTTDSVTWWLCNTAYARSNREKSTHVKEKKSVLLSCTQLTDYFYRLFTRRRRLYSIVSLFLSFDHYWWGRTSSADDRRIYEKSFRKTCPVSRRKKLEVCLSRRREWIEEVNGLDWQNEGESKHTLILILLISVAYAAQNESLGERYCLHSSPWFSCRLIDVFPPVLVVDWMFLMNECKYNHEGCIQLSPFFHQVTNEACLPSKLTFFSRS